MSDYEAIRAILQQAKNDRIAQTESKQIREIVPIEQWLSDPYYVGEDGARIYPFWQDMMKKIFDGNNQYNEIIMTGCQNENTKIPTSIGLLSYKELKERFDKGIRFKVLCDEGLQDCTNVFYTGFKDTFKITFEDGFELEGTKDHRIMTFRDNKIQWVYYDKIQVGDSILKYSSNQWIVDTPNQPNGLPYALGYFIGDGCIKGNTISICFGECSFNTDSDYFIKDFMLSQVKEGCKLRDYIGINNCNSTYKTYSIIPEDSIFNIFNSCSRGALNKNIPREVFTYNLHDICEFIAGLFDSDGCIEIDNRDKNANPIISYSSVNLSLIKNIQNLLMNLGIKSQLNTPNISGKHKNPCYRLRISDALSLIRFRDLIPLRINYKRDRLMSISLSKSSNIEGLRDYLYNNSKKLGLQIAKNNLHNKTMGLLRFNHIYNTNNLKGKDGLLDYLYDNQCYTVRVKSVVNSQCRTMDLTVDNTHKYMFSGFLTHNSIGTGKTTLSSYSMVRKLYEMSCYQNIQGLYGLMQTSKIAFMYFSVSRNQAELTGFGQIKNIIDSIPYFKDCFQRNEQVNSRILMPNDIMILQGSDSSHSIGMNLIGSILDEANFAQGETTDANEASRNTQSKVASTYASIVARGMSRFMRNGVNDSLSFLVSSATHSSSLTQQRIDNAGPNTLVLEPRLWDVKPKGTYSPKVFYVFTGNQSIDPKVVETNEDIKEIKQSLFIETQKDTIEEGIQDIVRVDEKAIVEVPEDFRRMFEIDFIKSLQDIAGVSTSPTGKLFTSKPTYYRCCTNTHGHPFTKDSFVISTNSDIEVLEYLKRDFTFKDKHLPHYIHVDLGITSDHTGISMVHPIGFNDEGNPIVYVDFKLGITPPKRPYKLSITKVRKFILMLRDVLNINIRCVSYDQAFSSESRQLLEEKGFKVEYTSVDRTDKAYLQLVNLYYENRIVDYSYAPYDRELFELDHMRARGKVDHPVGGSKDIADSLAGSVSNLMDDIPYLKSMLIEDTKEVDYDDYEDDDNMGFVFQDYVEANGALGVYGYDEYNDDWW